MQLLVQQVLRPLPRSVRRLVCRAVGLDPGGFAEQVRVPAELVDELLPVDGLDPALGTLIEPLACVLRAQDRAGLRFSPHFYTKDEELDSAIATVEEILKTRPVTTR